MGNDQSSISLPATSIKLDNTSVSTITIVLNNSQIWDSINIDILGQHNHAAWAFKMAPILGIIRLVQIHGALDWEGPYFSWNES